MNREEQYLIIGHNQAEELEHKAHVFVGHTNEAYESFADLAREKPRVAYYLVRASLWGMAARGLDEEMRQIIKQKIDEELPATNTDKTLVITKVQDRYMSAGYTQEMLILSGEVMARIALSQEGDFETLDKEQ